jgi:dynein heavy chain 1
MQSSSFYTFFQDQALSWDKRLNSLQLIIDDVLNIQQRYIYHDDISSSKDINLILSKSSKTFGKAERDFISLLKRVHQTKNVLSFTFIPNISSFLELPHKTVVTLQKQLNDYLEQQRSLFLRFFFLGDEDLLEIIRKGKAIDEIQKHFKKMFSEISHVTLEKNAITIFQVLKVNLFQSSSIF